ncbi:hypothetical protein MNBD_ALPHA01-1827 [hydrothermal vent metagenome]|uniref:Uncharacterized protein n=1 Tax=hydrothermal vent metagenome TaxID=652676 RepID=A0A3B0SDB2_9ZZZZ
MKLYDIKYWLEDKTTFSVREVIRAASLIALMAMGLFALAALTFGGEYLSGISLESLLEQAGILDIGWMAGHQGLFLHEIQIIFMITFILEIFFIISRYMRGWKL